MSNSLTILALLIVGCSIINARPLLNDDIVQKVNSDASSGWVAGRPSRFEKMSLEEATSMLMTSFDVPEDKRVYRDLSALTGTPPKHWDISDKYSKCASVQKIYDQKRCGGCWAFATTGSMSDRFCMQSEGEIDVILSPEALLSCDPKSRGCRGGWTDYSFDYISDEGLPTEECVPWVGNDIGCTDNRCTAPGVNMTKYYCTFGQFISKNSTLVMNLLSTDGPLTSVFEVFEDFFHYQSGVYKHVTGKYLGLHAVNIVGYGTSDDGLDYWTVKNSYGPDWGNKGHFNILRDNNGCNFEGALTAAEPKLHHKMD